MSLPRWILIVEPNLNFRRAIEAETLQCQEAGVEVVSVSYANEMVQQMTLRGSLPELLIVEWYASGDQIKACLQGMRKSGMLERLQVVATSGSAARQALCEAHSLGLRRFVCKYPNETSFRQKIADAIRELVPVKPTTPELSIWT